jgi:two-component system response regulator YesN
MITIVVADDEKIIRAGLKKILTSSMNVPLTIIEAKNGIEALDVCKKEQPDIIITDIRMPQMDGVELMKQLSSLSHHPAIIVLSGYDDFSYAKAAIQNGAVSYILKPVDKKELLSAVNEAVAVTKKEEKARNEKKLRAIVDEGRLETNDELLSCNFNNGLYVVTVTGDHCSEILSQTLQPVQYYILEQKKQFACFVIPREARYLLETDMSLSQFALGISTGSESISTLRTLCRQSFTAMLQCFFADGSNAAVEKKRIGIFSFVESDEPIDFSVSDKKYERCVSKLDIATAEEAQQSVDDLLSFSNVAPAICTETLNYVYNKITTNLFTRFPGYSDNDVYLHLKSIMIENIWQFENLDEWKHCVNDYIVYLTALLKRNQTEYPYIDDAIEYIKKHYTKNINMAMVANQVSVNYTWFSEKFKEHTGVNFNEYLKRLRLEEAERLLEQGCFKVYEVAERAGFGDVKYFMKTFKDSTNMSPTEWKRKHAANSTVED